MSTLPPAFSAAARMIESISALMASTRSRSSERHSPVISQRAATTFVARPPVTEPTFAVERASSRPNFIPAIASAAMVMALTPFSGATPA